MPSRATSPVRAARPAAPPSPPPSRRLRWRPPPGTLALTGVVAAFALGGFGYLGVRLTADLWPQTGPALRAPVADAFRSACVAHPAICRGSLRVRFRP
jgi:hypothetical protein